jgi:hypothetical protein
MHATTRRISEVALLPEFMEWSERRKAVIVPAILTQKRQQAACVVSSEVVGTLEHLNAPGRALCLAAIHRHYDRIVAAASLRIERDGLDPGAELRITAADVAATE